MELWIRSQNKRLLIKPNGLSFGVMCNKCGVYYENGCLGEYKTEERCIEIIDEIQNLLVKSNPKEAFLVLNNIECSDYGELEWKVAMARENNFIPTHDCDVQVVQPSVLVYEMPKE